MRSGDQAGQLAQDPFSRAKTLLRGFPLALDHHLVVRTDPPGNLVLGDELDQSSRVSEVVIAEGDDGTLGPDIDLGDIGLAAQALDGDNLEQLDAP